MMQILKMEINLKQLLMFRFMVGAGASLAGNKFCFRFMEARSFQIHDGSHRDVVL